MAKKLSDLVIPKDLKLVYTRNPDGTVTPKKWLDSKTNRPYSGRRKEGDNWYIYGSDGTNTKADPNIGALKKSSSTQTKTTNTKSNTTQSRITTPTYTPINRGRRNAVSNNGDYTIQQGDTLSALAKRYGTTVSNLMKWNGISNADRIYAGKKLITKSPTAGKVVDIDLSNNTTPPGYRMTAEQLMADNSAANPIKAKTLYDAGQYDLGVDTGETYKYSKGGKLKKRKSRVIDIDLGR